MSEHTHVASDRKLPPALPGLAALQIAEFIRNPVRFLEGANARYPDAFRFRLAGFPGWVNVLTHPDGAKELFQKTGDEVHAGKANAVLKPFLGEHSVLLLDGPEHARQRKLLMPPFHGDRMHAYETAMLEIAHQSIDGWALGEPVVLHRKMQDITLDVILRTVFGLDEGPRFREIATLLARGLDIVAWPPLLFPFMQKDLGPLSPWGRFVRISARVGELLTAQIHEARRMDRKGRTDVLSLLVDARDEAGQPMTDEEIAHELVTMLVAGHETSATGLAWAFHHVLRDKDLTKRVSDEARSGVSFAKSELLDHVAKEALRLRPVIPMVGRILQKDMRIQGFDFRTGEAVTASIFLIHRNPRLYPDPYRFDPDRYAGWKPAPWEYLPFGGGLRRCIGAAFAMLEMKIVLGAVFSRIDADLLLRDPRVVRRAITLTPEGGAAIRIRRKRPNPRVSLRGGRDGRDQPRVTARPRPETESATRGMNAMGCAFVASRTPARTSSHRAEPARLEPPSAGRAERSCRASPASSVTSRRTSARSRSPSAAPARTQASASPTRPAWPGSAPWLCGGFSIRSRNVCMKIDVLPVGAPCTPDDNGFCSNGFCSNHALPAGSMHGGRPLRLRVHLPAGKRQQGAPGT